MNRRLSLPLLLLLFIATPVLAGWMTAGHGAPANAPGGHAAHSESPSSPVQGADCTRQMSSLCLQLCSLSLLPYAANLPSLSAARPRPGDYVQTPTAPYLAPPLQPPRI